VTEFASRSVPETIETQSDRSPESDNVSPGIVLVCLAALVGGSLLLLAMNSSLVGDGSYYLLHAIQTRAPFPASGRQWINFIREVPLLLALHAGLTNTHVLAFLQGIGFIAFPAVVWTAAILQVRDSRVRFTIVTVACGLCFASTIFFSVSELTLALPLVVLASVLLTQSTPWSRPHAGLAFVATGLLFFSHESIVPCAVLLAGTALVRTRVLLRSRDSRVSILIVFLSVAVLGGALWTLVFWPNSNSQTFLNIPPSIVLLSVGAFFLLGWAVLYGRLSGLEWIRWIFLLVAVPVTLLGIHSAIRSGPFDAYSSRAMGVVVVVALQALLLADWIVGLQRTDAVNPRSMPSSIRSSVATIWAATRPVSLSRGAARGAAAFLVAVMFIPAVCAFRWSTVTDDFRSTITHHTGIVPAADVRTSLADTYLWSWTNSTLSVLLRSSTSNAIVENTSTMDIPFSDDRAEQQIPSTYRWGK
jgi:hypothetical protein